MLPIRLQVQNDNTATRTHIHVRKSQSRQDFIDALTYRAVAGVALAGAIVLGVFGMIGAAALIEHDRQIALAERV